MDYKVFEKMFGSWALKMKPFIESKEFDEIYRELKNEAKSGKIICPASYDTFRAFSECPMEELKCVMMLMDPYPWMKGSVMVADGIPMSCSNTGILQPSLEIFYDGIEEDLYNGLNLNINRNPDLRYLCNQGVLMLNSSMTTELNNVGAHKGLWTPFHEYLFENVLDTHTGIPVIFMGRQARDLKYLAGPNHHVLECEHPAAAEWRKGKWQHNNVFSKANEILLKNNDQSIVWAELNEVLIT